MHWHFLSSLYSIIFFILFSRLVEPVIFRSPLKRKQICLAFIFLKSGPLYKLKMTKVRVQNSRPEYFLLKQPLGQHVVLRGPYHSAAAQQYLPSCPHARNPKLFGAMASAVPQRDHLPFAWQEKTRLKSSPIAVPLLHCEGLCCQRLGE